MFCDIAYGTAPCVLEGASLFDATTDWLTHIPLIFRVHHNEPNPFDKVKVVAARVHREYDLSELGGDLFRMVNQHLHIEMPWYISGWVKWRDHSIGVVLANFERDHQVEESQC